MVTRFVGRDPIFRGKTLYELCCNLKNFGEGRVVYRHHINSRFPETSYYRLTSVQPDMADQTRQGGAAWAEKVYRGQRFGVCRINAGYKTDWHLVPRDREAEFCSISSVMPKKDQPPTHISCPPLLALLTKMEMEKSGVVPPSPEHFQLPLKPHKRKNPLQDSC